MHNFGVMAQVLLNGESRFLSPCDFKERLVAFVDHPLADVGNFGAHLEHDPLDAVPDRKITTRRAPRSAQPPQTAAARAPRPRRQRQTLRTCSSSTRPSFLFVEQVLPISPAWEIAFAPARTVGLAMQATKSPDQIY